MSYLVGSWSDGAGKPRFAAWTEDKPGKMHELMHNWLTTGATVEILDFIPDDNLQPDGSRSGCTSRVMRWWGRLNNEEQN
jgi:hypothetical protein